MILLWIYISFCCQNSSWFPKQVDNLIQTIEIWDCSFWRLPLVEPNRTLARSSTQFCVCLMSSDFLPRASWFVEIHSLQFLQICTDGIAWADWEARSAGIRFQILIGIENLCCNSDNPALSMIKTESHPRAHELQDSVDNYELDWCDICAIQRCRKLFLKHTFFEIISLWLNTWPAKFPGANLTASWHRSKAAALYFCEASHNLMQRFADVSFLASRYCSLQSWCLLLLLPDLMHIDYFWGHTYGRWNMLLPYGQGMFDPEFKLLQSWPRDPTSGSRSASSIDHQ